MNDIEQKYYNETILPYLDRIKIAPNSSYGVLIANLMLGNYKANIARSQLKKQNGVVMKPQMLDEVTITAPKKTETVVDNSDKTPLNQGTPATSELDNETTSELGKGVEYDYNQGQQNIRENNKSIADAIEKFQQIPEEIKHQITVFKHGMNNHLSNPSEEAVPIDERGNKQFDQYFDLSNYNLGYVNSKNQDQYSAILSNDFDESTPNSGNNTAGYWKLHLNGVFSDMDIPVKNINRYYGVNPTNGKMFSLPLDSIPDNWIAIPERVLTKEQSSYPVIKIGSINSEKAQQEKDSLKNVMNKYYDLRSLEYNSLINASLESNRFSRGKHTNRPFFLEEDTSSIPEINTLNRALKYGSYVDYSQYPNELEDIENQTNRRIISENVNAIKDNINQDIDYYKQYAMSLDKNSSDYKSEYEWTMNEINRCNSLLSKLNLKNYDNLSSEDLSDISSYVRDINWEKERLKTQNLPTENYSRYDSLALDSYKKWDKIIPSQTGFITSNGNVIPFNYEFMKRYLISKNGNSLLLLDDPTGYQTDSINNWLDRNGGAYLNTPDNGLFNQVIIPDSTENTKNIYNNFSNYIHLSDYDPTKTPFANYLYFGKTPSNPKDFTVIGIKKRKSGGRLIPKHGDGTTEGGVVYTADPNKTTNILQCAAYANERLREAFPDHADLIYGSAWSRPGEVIVNGYDSVPSNNPVTAKQMVQHGIDAANYLGEHFDINTLNKNKVYQANMYYHHQNGDPSPYAEEGYMDDDGNGVRGTHTGNLYWNGSDWIVEHNIHGKIYQQSLSTLLSGKGNWGVTALQEMPKTEGEIMLDKTEKYMNEHQDLYKAMLQVPVQLSDATAVRRKHGGKLISKYK